MTGQRLTPKFLVLTGLAVSVLGWSSALAEVQFARGGHARIPFDLQGGHVWVRGVIGGSDSLWIAVDTGASWGAIDEGVARGLGLKLRGRHETTGAGGVQPSSSVSDITLRVGGLSIHRQSFDTVDFGALSALSVHPLQVVLGHELFASCVVRFDFAAGVMEVWDVAHAPPRRPEAETPLTFEENHPYVEAALKLPGRPPLAGRFVLDTGSGAALILAPEVTERDSLLRAFPRTLQAVGRGVGGERRNHVGRAESFTLGGLRFDGPLVLMPDPGAGRFNAPGTLGNIGGEVLRRCRVTFDYARRRVCIERATGFETPFEGDMSGMALTRGPSGWQVVLVNADTPAAEAGVRAGDRITRVDDLPAERLDTDAMRRAVRRDGHRLQLGLQRGDSTTTVTLVLRRLL